MSTTTTEWYPSKVDWWLVPLLSLAPVASIVACISLVLEGQLAALPWAVGGVLLVLGVYFGMVIPMTYGLDDTTLIVRFGICRQRIALADILEVRPTHNPLSSPALSLDRLRIQFGPGLFKAVMISPADRDRFLDDLAERAGLTREGDRLVRM